LRSGQKKRRTSARDILRGSSSSAWALSSNDFQAEMRGRVTSCKSD
jgi:hypothetical protein